MAILKGKKLTGLVGPLVLKEDRGQQIVQTKPEHVNQTIETKKCGVLFGKASRIANKIRTDLHSCYWFPDRDMVNRCTTLMRSILDHCSNRDTNSYAFASNSFDKLVGFEFNVKSLLSNSLWIKPETKLEDNKLSLRIPALEIPDQIKFPKGATHVKFFLASCLYSPETGHSLRRRYEGIEISNKSGTSDAYELIIDVPEGCLCVVGLGLEYYALSQDIKTKLNTKTFDPAGICAVIMNPGTFSIESLDKKIRWDHDYDLILKSSALEDTPSAEENLEDSISVVEDIKVTGGKTAVKTKKNKVLSQLLETAREMKKDGLSIELIMKYTGISAEEIEGL